jgi:hypothetical protein
MQPLLRTLQDHDLGHFRILADTWGFDPPTGPPVQAARTLAAAMLDPASLGEMIDSLPRDAREALQALQSAGGRVPLADLTRRFGPLREVGAGRRDREKIWRHPASSLETLWYRGLLARAFADSPTGPCEFGFIPSDILVLLNPGSPMAVAPLGRPALEPAIANATGDSALDDALTLLAALRRRPSRDLELSDAWLKPFTRHLQRAESAHLLVALLRDLGVVQGPPLRPNAREVHDLLELPGAAIHARLIHAWAESSAWNDLAHVPGLQRSGVSWPNDPLAARRLIVGWLSDVPRGQWWDLEEFVTQVHEMHPGFQRPAGDFDSWYLQEASTGEFLRGFQHWEAVEGRLLRFVVTGPLQWLGVVEVGIEAQARQVTAFRTRPLFEVLAGRGSPTGEDESHAAASLFPDGRVVVPRTADRALRYQVARWAAWGSPSPDGYAYRITPRAVEAAGKQGLRAEHVLAILKAACAAPVPEPLERAIERAAARGTEARVHAMLVLRVSSPRLLEELRRRRATARFLGETLGSDSVALRSEDWPALCEAAARLGLLIEPPTVDD